MAVSKVFIMVNMVKTSMKMTFTGMMMIYGMVVMLNGHSICGQTFKMTPAIMVMIIRDVKW